MRRLFPIAFFAALLSCGAQETSTDGLGRRCDHDGDCEKGQACLVTARTPEEQPVTTCQIPCGSSNDCPQDFVCRSGTRDIPASICVKNQN